MNPAAHIAVLRLAAAVVPIGAMLAAGVLHRSPWIVALMTPVFTLFYALGKWQAWHLTWRMGGTPRILRTLCMTLPIQALVVATFYVLGFGVGALLSVRDVAALDAMDLLAAAAVLLIGLVASMAIVRSESSSESAQSMAPTPAPSHPELVLDPMPLTPESFFVPPHGQPMIGADSALIAATEARLGVTLPAALRALYLRSNGGFVGDLYVPRRADPRPVFADWRGAFAIDYSSLAPLERLRSVAEHYADFTDDPEDIPEHADRRIVLIARYDDMTLLDYSESTEPRVLLARYDRGDENPIDLAFPTFDAFFAALRRAPR